MSMLSQQARLGVALCSLAAFTGLCGCQNGLAGHRIIARMNDSLIDQDQLVDRMQRITAANFTQTLQFSGRQADPQLDAGAVALIAILRDTAIDQLAKQKGFVPSDTAVDAIYNYERERALDPSTEKQLRQDPNIEALQKHDFRLQEEVLAIGTDGGKVEDSDLQTEFNALKSRLDIPERIGVRVLKVQSEDDGLSVLNRLKANGDFQAEERHEQAPAGLDGTERYFPADMLKKQAQPLYDALKGLNPGQFAPAPITLSLATSPGQSQSLIVVAQFTKHLPGKSVTLDEVRPLISQSILTKRYPQYQPHFFEQLFEFLQSQAKNLEIYPDRYARIVKAYLFAPPQQVLAPSGATGGTQMPQSPESQGAPPPGTSQPGSAQQ